VSTARLGHAFKLKLSQPDRRNQVDIDELSVDLGLCVDGKTALTDARVVYQNIDSALPGPRLVHLACKHIVIGHFKWKDQTIHR